MEESALDNPELIIIEIDRLPDETSRHSGVGTELQQAERQLRTLSHEQEQFLRWALKRLPEEMVVGDSKRLKQKPISLQTRMAERRAQIIAGQEATTSHPIRTSASAKPLRIWE